MKNTMKKIAAFTAATLITAALAMPVFAAPITGTPVDLDDAAAENVTFTINKDIVLFNVSGADIYEPNVTYTYEVAPVTPTDATIVDKNDNKVKVCKGVEDAVQLIGNKSTAKGDTANVVFGNETGLFESNEEGSTVSTDSITVDEELGIYIDASVIYEETKKPGVYRYKISDTTSSATLTAAGISRDENYDEDLYLDVYTKYNDTRDGLLVYGYVLYRDGEASAPNHPFDYDEETENEATKMSGFDIESEHEYDATEQEYTDDIISDQYHTYNVTVQKKTDGALADDNNEFPFEVTLSNATVTSGAEFTFQQTGGNETKGVFASGGWTFADAFKNATNPETLTLKNGDTLTITGVPVDTKILVTETNNTNDVYTMSVTKDGTALTVDSTTGATNTQQLILEPNGKGGLLAAEDIEVTGEDGDVIIFTNTLEEISPTGLFFALAPFAAMLGFGAVMITLFVKNKKRDESDDMI